MVIGNGLIAKVFYDQFLSNDEVLIFASGVSNSKSTENGRFEREKDLLIATAEQYHNKLVVYFSTCSVYDPTEKNCPYVRHKLDMERIVETSFKKFIVCRVSNVVGKTLNKTTIFNFLFYHIIESIPFKLWKNAYRNIIDVQDVAQIVNYCIHNCIYHNQIINIANDMSYSVKELVHEMEAYLQKNAIYTLVDAGAYYEIDLDKTKELIIGANVDFSGNYVQGLLKKYYSKHEIE